VEKYVRARQTTDGICNLVKTTDTHNVIFKTYCFSKATMITRTHLSGTLYVHSLSNFPVLTQWGVFRSVG